MKSERGADENQTRGEANKYNTPWAPTAAEKRISTEIKHITVIIPIVIITCVSRYFFLSVASF